MDTATRVQIANESICISHGAIPLETVWLHIDLWQAVEVREFPNDDAAVSCLFGFYDISTFVGY